MARERKIYTYKGFYGNLSEICEHFGVSYIAVWTRMKKGMSFEKSISTPIEDRNKRSVCDKIYTHNEFSGSLQKVCDYFKVNKSLITMRLKNGSDFNKVINSEIQKQKIYNFQGFEGNIYEIRKRFKLSHYKVYLLIKDETIIEAQDAS